MEGMLLPLLLVLVLVLLLLLLLLLLHRREVPVHFPHSATVDSLLS